MPGQLRVSSCLSALQELVGIVPGSGAWDPALVAEGGTRTNLPPVKGSPEDPDQAMLVDSDQESVATTIAPRPQRERSEPAGFREAQVGY